MPSIRSILMYGAGLAIAMLLAFIAVQSIQLDAI